jgi:hypothetical protein
VIDVPEGEEQRRVDGLPMKELLLRQIAARTAAPVRDLGRLATSFRLIREQLEWSPASRYADKAADGLERAARFIEEADAERWTKQVRELALRKPLLFMGAAWLIGFGGGRFLRSSAASEGQRNANEEPQQPTDRTRKAAPWLRDESKEARGTARTGARVEQLERSAPRRGAAASANRNKSTRS